MLRLVEAPAESVLTLAEVKAHLRVDHDDEDALIEGLMAAAVARLDGRDGILGRCLMPQTWEYCLSAFPSCLQIPLPPTIDVVSVSYLDLSETLQEIDADTYRVVPGGWAGARIFPVAGQSWPTQIAGAPDAVRVVFLAGYESVADSPPESPVVAVRSVPRTIIQAMLLMIRDWYDERGNVVVGQSVAHMPFAAEALLAPHRIIPIA